MSRKTTDIMLWQWSWGGHWGRSTHMFGKTLLQNDQVFGVFPLNETELNQADPMVVQLYQHCQH
jgi:hypothetical protein